MEFFKQQSKIDFMGKRKIIGSVSIILSIIALIIIFTKGLNVGLEFTGGMQVELRFTNSIEPELIREKLLESGIKEVRVQHYGTSKDILIRLVDPDLSNEEKITKKIREAFGSSEDNTVEIRRIDFVGSEVGDQLVEQGTIAVLAAILATILTKKYRNYHTSTFDITVTVCILMRQRRVFRISLMLNEAS